MDGPSRPRKPIAGPSAFLPPPDPPAEHLAHGVDDFSEDSDQAGAHYGEDGSEFSDGSQRDSVQRPATRRGDRRQGVRVLAPVPRGPDAPTGVCLVLTMILVFLCVRAWQPCLAPTPVQFPHTTLPSHSWSMVQGALMLPFILLAAIIASLVIVALNFFSYMDHAFAFLRLCVLSCAARVTTAPTLANHAAPRSTPRLGPNLKVLCAIFLIPGALLALANFCALSAVPFALLGAPGIQRSGPFAVLAAVLGSVLFAFLFPMSLNYERIPNTILGPDKGGAFVFAFMATPVQLAELWEFIHVMAFEEVYAIMEEARCTQRQGGPIEFSFLDAAVALLLWPFLAAACIVGGTLILALKAPLLLGRLFVGLWGRASYYGFARSKMRDSPCLVLGFMGVNLMLPVLLALAIAWSPLWGLWHASVACAQLITVGPPIAQPLHYFGLPAGYALSKLLLLNSESNAFICGGATNLLAVIGMDTTPQSAKTGEEAPPLNLSAAALSVLVGLIALPALCLLWPLYLLAVAPLSILLLYSRAIAAFTAKERPASAKFGFILLFLFLLPALLVAMVLGMALAPFTAVLPALRTYYLDSFTAGLRGIPRVLLSLDARIMKQLYAVDDAVRVSMLPAAVWACAAGEDGVDGVALDGSLAAVYRPPRKDEDIAAAEMDPVASATAAQLAAQHYGVRGMRSAAGAAKAAAVQAQLAAVGTPKRGEEPRADDEEPVDVYSTLPHERRTAPPSRVVGRMGHHSSEELPGPPQGYSATAAAERFNQGQSSMQGGLGGAGALADPACESQRSTPSGSVVADCVGLQTTPSASPLSSEAPSRESSIGHGTRADDEGASVRPGAVQRTLREETGLPEGDEVGDPCCLCCRSRDPIAHLYAEEEAEEEGAGGMGGQPEPDIEQGRGGRGPAPSHAPGPVPPSHGEDNAAPPTEPSAHEEGVAVAEGKEGHSAGADDEQAHPPPGLSAAVTSVTAQQRFAAAWRRNAGAAARSPPPHLRGETGPSLPKGKARALGRSVSSEPASDDSSEEDALPLPPPSPPMSATRPPADDEPASGQQVAAPESAPVQPVPPPVPDFSDDSDASPAPTPEQEVPAALSPSAGADTPAAIGDAVSGHVQDSTGPEAADSSSDSYTSEDGSHGSGTELDQTPDASASAAPAEPERKEAPIHKGAAVEQDAPQAASAAGQSQPALSRSPAAAAMRKNLQGNLAVLRAAAKVTGKHGRSKAALERARAALKAAEQASIAAQVEADVQASNKRLAARRPRDRQADSALAMASPGRIGLAHSPRK